MLEDLLANEFVVAVDNNKDLVGFAELMGSPLNVGHGHVAFLVDDDREFLRRDVPLLDVVPHVGAGSVFGGIVDEDDAVVVVVLLQDRLQVVSVAAVLHVVVAGNHHADRQLLVLRYRVMLLIIGFFL